MPSQVPYIAPSTKDNLDQLNAIKYIKLIAPFAVKVARETGIPASLSIAQSAQETGWGKKPLGGNNFHGLKGKGPEGSVFRDTHEFEGGEMVLKTGDDPDRRFAAFSDTLSGFRAYAGKISNGPYQKARDNIDDSVLMGHALTGIYATDPEYGSKIENIITGYNLKQFDEPDRGPLPGPITDAFFPSTGDTLTHSDEVPEGVGIQGPDELPQAPPAPPNRTLGEELTETRGAFTHGAAGRALQKVTGRTGESLGGEAFMKAVIRHKVPR